MIEFIIKAIIGGVIIAGVVTAAQRGNATLGALLLGIPLTSIVSIIFMHYAGVENTVFTQLAKETIVFVLVSLIFFPLFAYMVMNYPFWFSLVSATTVTMSALFLLKIYLEN